MRWRKRRVLRLCFGNRTPFHHSETQLFPDAHPTHRAKNAVILPFVLGRFAAIFGGIHARFSHLVFLGDYQVEKQSFGNMISQLNIEENDYINVLANQRDRIAELESELLKIKEKNRAKTKRISKLEERLKNLSEKNEEQDD